MFEKNVVWLSLKLAVTNAHDHTRSLLMLYGQVMMIHSQNSCVITHRPQEPPTARQRTQGGQR